MLLCSSPEYYSTQGQDRQFEIGGFALKGTILVKKTRVIQGSRRWRSGEVEGAVGSESDAGFAQSPSDVRARNPAKPLEKYLDLSNKDMGFNGFSDL